MRETTCDIELSGAKYRLGKLPVGMASWLLVKVMGVLLSSNQEADDEANEESKKSKGLARFLEAFSRLSQDDFLEIQNRILATVCRYEDTKNGTTPMPIMKSAGVFSYPEMQYDIKAIMGLTMQGVNFNIAPFFASEIESA